MQSIKLYCPWSKTKAVTAVSVTSHLVVEVEINGCLKCSNWSEWGEHRCFDLIMAHSPVSAFSCSTPWITALMVISTATAGLFELEIYSSAFIILICGGSEATPILFSSYSSRIQLLISTGSRLAGFHGASWIPFFRFCELLYLCRDQTSHVERTKATPFVCVDASRRRESAAPPCFSGGFPPSICHLQLPPRTLQRFSFPIMRL